MSDRIVAALIAIVAVLMVVGLQAVMPANDGRGPAVTDSRGEPFP